MYSVCTVIHLSGGRNSAVQLSMIISISVMVGLTNSYCFLFFFLLPEILENMQRLQKSVRIVIEQSFGNLSAVKLRNVLR